MLKRTQPNYEKKHPHLVWVYSGSLDRVFDSATWLEPTRELRRLGWRVSLIAFGRRGVNTVQGVEIYGLPTIENYFLRHFIFHLQLILYLLTSWSTIDFILFHGTSAPWLLPLKLLRWVSSSRRPLFVMDTRTILMEDLRKGTWRDRIRGWFYRLTSFLANRWADGQTANTQRMADCVGVPPKNLWGVWPAGVNPTLFRSARLIRHWPMKNDPIHIMYIGVVNYERNLMALCRAVEMANLEGMHFTLTITGDGTQRHELEQFASETDGIIRIKRAIPHEQIPDLLSRAHIGAIPFPDEEKFRVGSPIKLFEYLAAGLPILATRIVCNTDVIGEGAYVFWAEDSSVEGLLAALRIVWEKEIFFERTQ